MLDAATLIQASALLTGPPGGYGHDPLAGLACRTPPRTAPAAVPSSWRGASPALRTRVTRARSRWLSPADQLRHATTLTTARTPAPPGQPDIAITRAGRLPDQLWADWAIRLTDGPTTRHDTFRPAALTALLLPHSHLPLRQVTTLASRSLKPHATSHQMSRLSTAALRILTELAFAIDGHDIPINYSRRRDLAAHTTLIDEPSWHTMARDTGMNATHPRHARRYLYELLTAGSLHTAPPPCHLPATKDHASYHEFTVGVTTDLAAALREHALLILRGHSIDGEPLEWQPPTRWVPATTWPGVDPARTDPTPIHHALLHTQAPPGAVAADLGISPGHLRQVLHHHPLPRPRRPLRRTLIPRPAPASPPPGQQPGVLYLDPAWLREEYLTRHRPLHDIATQLGCPTHLLNRFAHTHGIPVRPRGHNAATPRPQPPPGLPEPLRYALTGPDPLRRLHHLSVIAGHPSIHHAAQAHGTWHSTFYAQVTVLERACGGLLIHRNPRPPGTGTLTPLGRRLLRQAHDHLGLTAPALHGTTRA